VGVGSFALNMISARNDIILSDASPMSDYQMGIYSTGTGIVEGCGIQFSASINEFHSPGAAIVFERTEAENFSGSLHFKTQGNNGFSDPLTKRLTITRGGRIGMGTTNPTQALDVVGSINCSGQFLVNGSPISTGAGFSGNYNDLTNKPASFSGNYNDLTNKPAVVNTWGNITISGDVIKGTGDRIDIQSDGDIKFTTDYNNNGGYLQKHSWWHRNVSAIKHF